jgi:hypothetical protein
VRIAAQKNKRSGETPPTFLQKNEFLEIPCSKLRTENFGNILGKSKFSLQKICRLPKLYSLKPP